MKPLKLTIQAFGPFVDKEVIDFSLLGNSPLFLINGPTGSGKSSILDAICFALYGKTTGNEREAAQMRCDMADPNTLTEIIFDFSLGDKQYRVSRSPTQERSKSRGEGLTEHNGEAHLWEIDSAGETSLMVTKKLKEVTDAIEYITGLNVEQFRQVMVLPQGKFRELLLADSADREKIFSKLFQTNIYKRIEESLKTKAISINNDKKAHDNQIKGILESADLTTEDELKNELIIISPELTELKKQKEEKNKALQIELSKKESAEKLLNQYAEHASTQSKIKEKEELKSEIEQNKQTLKSAINAQKITPVYDELIRLQKEKQQLTEEFKSAESQGKQLALAYEKTSEDLKQSKDKSKETDVLKLTANELKQYETKVDKLEEKRKTEKESELSYKTNHQNTLNKQKELEKQNQNKQSLEKIIAQIQQNLTELGAKQLELKSLEQQKQQLQKLDIKRTEFNEFIKQQKVTQKQFESLEQEFEISLKFSKQQELHWHTGQAANLAKELKQNEPCPVCGSLEHPNPVRLVDGDLVDNMGKELVTLKLVTLEQVDSARSLAEENRTAMQNTANKLNDLSSQIKQINKIIDELEKELGKTASVALDDVNNKYDVLNNEVETLEKSKQELKGLQQKMVQHDVDIEKIKSEMIKAQDDSETSKITHKLNQAAVETIEKELPEQYRNKLNLIEEIKKNEKKIKTLAELLETAQTNFDECKTSITKHETHLKGLKTTDAKLSLQLSKAEANWEIKIQSSSFKSDAQAKSVEQYKSAILSEHAQEELSNVISAYNDELTHLNGQLEQQEKALKESVKPDLEAISGSCKEKQIVYNEAENVWKKLDARVNQLKDVKAKLKKAHEKSAKLQEEYAIYGTLSNVANGRTGNNVSLQRFVLSVLLDDVLIEASRRLSIMTRGQYQLLRRQDKSKGNKASGLELDVDDAYTGKTRSVATLSGGESFMAALALALGLSDVVQAYAGGIKLDTLFIDEGFGSLDQESLDLAIRTLIDLQASGRTIGIISHVSELKEQMALRLDVISSKTGSTIKTVAA